MCLCKAAIVGQCNNRPWQLSLAEPRLSAAILLGIRMAACAACTSPCVCPLLPCACAQVCAWARWQTARDTDPKWSLESDSPPLQRWSALSWHQTLKESCSLRSVRVIPSSVRPSVHSSDWVTHSLTMCECACMWEGFQKVPFVLANIWCFSQHYKWRHDNWKERNSLKRIKLWTLIVLPWEAVLQRWP